MLFLLLKQMIATLSEVSFLKGRRIKGKCICQGNISIIEKETAILYLKHTAYHRELVPFSKKTQPPNSVFPEKFCASSKQPVAHKSKPFL